MPEESTNEYLSRSEILAWKPYTHPPKPGQERKDVIDRLKRNGQWNHKQMGGRSWAMGCVSLEITQRCNLDCTLCYLSEHSEAVKDIPLEEIFRRIDMIRAHYGANCDVQVSGGDPTVRNRQELVEIIRYIRKKELKPSLLTNGILATRSLLTELRDAGLVDVAFHVDITQERKGFANEKQLNRIRKQYIERAQGLGLGIFFNTTVCAQNFLEIPDLVRFFIAHAKHVGIASFQLQADTGRGVLRERDFLINPETVGDQIRKGANYPIDFDALQAGHSDCNQYAFLFEMGGKVHQIFEDNPFIHGLMDRQGNHPFDRQNRWQVVKTVTTMVLKNKDLWKQGAKFIGRKLWTMKKDLVQSRGEVNKIMFFMHNFMDAQKLERERCDSCVFMAMSGQGPMSMCVFNAKRDQYILKPIALRNQPEKIWDPLTGQTTDERPPQQIPNPEQHPIRHLKGRTRQIVMENKKKKGKPTPAKPKPGRKKVKPQPSVVSPSTT